jgi:hypothetical protein
VEQPYRLTFFRLSLPPTRLVVVSKFFSNASPVRSPGPTPIWPSKAKRHFNLGPCRSDLILTPTLLGSTATHQKCMVNKAHLFEDMRLNKDKGQANGISNGLETAGKGTFKFNIKDNEGKQHTIRIKDSLYIPKMRRCLLSPQHWAQKAGDKQIWMELKRQWPYDCIRNWKGGKKTIPHQPLTNVPVFYTASSSMRYHAFAATFKAMDASFL